MDGEWMELVFWIMGVSGVVSFGLGFGITYWISSYWLTSLLGGLGTTMAVFGLMYLFLFN